MNLDDQQQAAVASTAKTTIVAAGPGSGKSRCIVARINRAINEGIAPDKIAVITFTNSGAREIVSRLSDETRKALLFAGTIHGYMLDLLQQHGWQIGYRKAGSITILTEEAADELMLRTKLSLNYPKCSVKETAVGYTDRAKIIRAKFRSEVKRSNMVTFDQILVDGLRLLRNMGEFRPLVELLLVDEAQDSSQIDWDIFTEIRPIQAYITGDGDQSIFGFRGACPRLFKEAAETPGVALFRLEHNYRSDIEICEAANNLIEHNEDRIKKTTNPHSKKRGIIYVDAYESAEEERINICKSINSLISNGHPANEIAVLALTNVLVDELRNALVSHGIPVARSTRTALPADWSFCLTTIQLMMDRQNNLLAESYLKGIGYSLPNMNREIIESMKTGKSLATISELPEWKPTFQNLPELLAKAGVDASSVGLVLERIQQMPQAFPTMQEIISDLWRSDDWDTRESSGVRVSTIHKIKGHEFNSVFIAGCEEGVLPKLSKNEDLEESRRIFFVAITRARHLLTMTHCARRFLYGHMVEHQPSRFIAEIQSNP